MLTLAGLLGLPWMATGASGSRPDESLGSSVLDGDLNLNRNSILNVGTIQMAPDRPALQTSGTGDGSVEIWDTVADDWAMRVTESDPDAPGPVEFNAPISGPATDGRTSPSLAVDGAVDADGLSVDSWRIVDVRERGVEPGSDTDLGAFVQRHMDREDVTGAIYYLPEGTYTWNTKVTVRQFDSFGIVGRPRARVRCTNPEMSAFLDLGTGERGDADVFVARDVTFDVRTPDVAASAIIAAVDETLEIDNCSLVGELDRVVPPYYSITPALVTERGRGYVSVTMPDGSFCDPSMKEQDHPMGLAIERHHRGYLVVENTDIEGFVNNGIYSAGHNGKVAIRNTSVKNCGAGMLRLGDGDYAYKCHLVNDDAEDRGYSYAALWVTDAGHAVADSVEIVARQATPSELVRVNGDVDHCVLTNFDVKSHANQHVCSFTGEDPTLGQVVAANWTVSDTGSAESNAHLGRIDRPNVVLKNWNVTIDPAGTGKRHGLVVDAPWVDVLECSFTHTTGGLDLLLDDGADYLRLKNCDFKRGQLYQYERATTDGAIVSDNRFVDGVALAGTQENWTARGPEFQ
ncbi:hypothetical protein EGH21_14930 [Halomicroarcula sp. F13]|uniref:Pectate lyase superfamily protein domain-containing protein n=1 Tax=Haloarcula rubra TaxID=2487747 RepID=A0AAW4PVR0_9EURY|nr:glycosyl hydrolase family 28-related protein [Halomicroarcula rubra]MBX0324322.1 hypothetical protein [Halomicroarcula rubra]